MLFFSTAIVVVLNVVELIAEILIVVHIADFELHVEWCSVLGVLLKFVRVLTVAQGPAVLRLLMRAVLCLMVVHGGSHGGDRGRGGVGALGLH